MTNILRFFFKVKKALLMSFKDFSMNIAELQCSFDIPYTVNQKFMYIITINQDNFDPHFLFFFICHTFIFKILIQQGV